MDIIKVQKQAFKHLAEGEYSQAGDLWQACIDKVRQGIIWGLVSGF